MQITRYLKRIKELGPLGAWNRTFYRINRKLFALRWKQKALARQANHRWEAIAKKHKLDTDFRLFFKKCAKKSFCKNFFLAHERAIFDKTPWSNKKINLFYQDIRPSNSSRNSLDEYAPDIKEPWELARFQHKFDHTDVEQWIDQNPFLLGVNWVCPMEVAIRAINWIIWFQETKNSQEFSFQFWKKFICSLYDHAYYLENNWETSDRPNNHYVTDLVGYFYLCSFFDHIKHFEKAKQITYENILAQFDHQIHPDGTSYEGSTAYHKLVTELFWLFSLACKKTKTFLPDLFYEKFDRMVMFIKNCSINKRDFVQIGDNDSGVIRGPVPCRSQSKKDLVHYPNFGLTIINKPSWHITFRHPTYQPHQPTSHFHQDELAVTLAYKTIPVLVDPGSYVYTSNKAWRNLMRSYPSHNTFYSQNQQEIDTKIDLFQLPKQTQPDTAKIFHNKNFISIQNFFQNRTRKITLEKKFFFIEDTFIPSLGALGAIWALNFHPEITVNQITPMHWEIFYQNKKLLLFTSNLPFSATNGFYSPQYGVVQPTTKLIAQEIIDPPKTKANQRLNSATAFLNNSCFHVLKFAPASNIKMP